MKIETGSVELNNTLPMTMWRRKP